MGRFATVFLALMLFTACPDAGPVDVTRQFVGALVAYTEMPAPDRLEQAFELLDATTRSELTARARSASEALASAVEPWELLRFDGFVRGDRLGRVEEVLVGDERARVAVQTSWAVPAGSGGPTDPPEGHELVLVREDGEWRVSLPSLAGGSR